MAGCKDTLRAGGTCGASSAVVTETGTGRAFPVLGNRITALPETRLSIELRDAPAAGQVAWSWDAHDGTITGDASGRATVVAPSSTGTYTITAHLTRTDGTTCDATLTLEVSAPSVCDAAQLTVNVVTAGLPDVPLVTGSTLPPSSRLDLRASSASTTSTVSLALASGSGGALTDLGGGLQRLDAPSASPSTVDLVGTSRLPNGGLECQRPIGLFVHDGCPTFPPVIVRGGSSIPFGNTPVMVPAGSSLELGVLGGNAPGVEARFAIVEGAAGGSIVTSSTTTASYQAPATDGAFNLRALVLLNGALACSASQPVTIGAPSSSGPLRSPWPRNYLSVAGTRIVGGRPNLVATMMTDGTGYTEVSGGNNTNVGGAAATTAGAFWSFAPSDATLLYGTSPNPNTFYDTVNGTAGVVASDGTNVFYVVYAPAFGSLVRKVSPPTSGGQSVSTAQVANVLIGSLTTANGYVYWAKSLGVGSLPTITRRAISLASAEQTVLSSGELQDATRGIAGIAADDTRVWAIYSQVDHLENATIRTALADGTSVTSQPFATTPGAIAIAVDATHVYWLTRDAHVRRLAKTGGGAIEEFASVAGATGWALALDASHVYFSVDDALWRRPK